MMAENSPNLSDAIAKMKDSIDDKEKKLILQVLSQAMAHYGAVLPTDSQYGSVHFVFLLLTLTLLGTCLNKVAEVQNQIAVEQSKFVRSPVSSSYEA